MMVTTGQPLNVPAVPDAVVAVRVHVGQRQSAPHVRIDDDDVGVAADCDDTLAGIEAEQLGDRGGGDLDEALDGQLLAGDALREQERHARLDAVVATGGVVDLLTRNLLCEGNGEIVGTGHVEHVGAHRLPQRAAVLGRFQRRVVVIDHAVGAGVVLVAEGEVIVQRLRHKPAGAWRVPRRSPRCRGCLTHGQCRADSRSGARAAACA